MTAKSAALETVALEDLVALADEMAALVRAGVPLERGLAQVSRDLSGRPGIIAADIAGRLQRGEPLLDVLAGAPQTFPPAFCAVVEAGLGTGRLATALEGIASATRRAVELRRLTRAALFYPLVIALLAYGFFIVSLVWLQPRITQMYGAMETPPSAVNITLADLGRSAGVWAPWIPLAVAAGFALWWYRSGKTAWSGRGIFGLTPAGRVLRYGRLATFADVLALLVDHGRPLGHAVTLAAAASGDRSLQQAAQQFAADIQRGAAPQETLRRQAGFPPLVGWLLVGGGSQTALTEALRNMAESYRRRAVRLDDWLRSYLPLALAVMIGGTAVALYALSMLGPWYHMLTNIAGPQP